MTQFAMELSGGNVSSKGPKTTAELKLLEIRDELSSWTPEDVDNKKLSKWSLVCPQLLQWLEKEDRQAWNQSFKAELSRLGIAA